MINRTIKLYKLFKNYKVKVLKLNNLANNNIKLD